VFTGVLTLFTKKFCWGKTLAMCLCQCVCLQKSLESNEHRFHRRWSDQAETACFLWLSLLKLAVPSKSPDTRCLSCLPGGISLHITFLRGREDLEILSEDTQWDMGAVNLRCLCFGMAGVIRSCLLRKLGWGICHQLGALVVTVQSLEDHSEGLARSIVGQWVIGLCASHGRIQVKLFVSWLKNINISVLLFS
jgi:hypothetical protein